MCWDFQMEDDSKAALESIEVLYSKPVKLLKGENKIKARIQGGAWAW